MQRHFCRCGKVLRDEALTPDREKGEGRGGGRGGA